MRGPEGWAARIVRVALVGFGLFIVLNWIIFVWDLVGSSPPPFAGIGVSLALIALLLAWTLALCLLWGRDEREMIEAKKYGGRPLEVSEAKALIARARELLASESDLSSRGVEPRLLAARLGAPYYLLSRAVNEGEGLTLSDLVNEYRIDRAKRLLIEKPSSSILDVALDAGFAAKSTFNEVFRRMVGMSPSEYRSRACH